MTAQDRAQAREALLDLLARQTNAPKTRILAEAIAGMDATAQDRAQARDALLGSLDRQTSASEASNLAETVAVMGPTAQERDRGRQTLLRLLNRESDSIQAGKLTNSLVGLNPTTGDLAGWQGWRVPPDSKLLAAARRNSAIPDWLAALPSLAGLHAR